MNTNWSKILLFSLLSFALGVIVTHICIYHCGHRGGHGGDRCCEMRDGCEHGGTGDCCHMGGMHAEMKGGKCCMEEGEGDHEARVHAIIHGIKDSNFQGDTTVKIDDGTVHITRHGDKMQVKVEISDSMKVEEKEVQVKVR